MPDATITSTASTFGTITGTFAADQSTVTGTISGVIAGTLTGSVGVPGPAGPAGIGIPSGGLEGQVLLKASDTSYDTAWYDNYAATLQATVRNETGATLSKGTVVYISGGAGNKPLVTKASASSESSSSKTFAILAQDIPTNQNGQAVTMGLLKGLNTTSFTAGANLWLSTTAGQIVSPTPPASPAHAVFLGNVVRVHATQGEIEVRIQNGYELGELHDVLLDTPANGQVLKYDSAQGLWINGNALTSVAWGDISGTLSNQTDLQTALNGKYSTSNPAGYITSSALTGYATESWVTSQGYLTASSLTPYLTKADNLGSLTNFATARSNLSLGTLDTPVFAGVTAQGSGSNVAYLTPTSLTLTHATSGTFTIQPSAGITFPDSSVQTTAFTTAQLSAYLAKASNLSDLASASTARTNLGLGSLAVVNDAPSDGNQYARKNGAWDVVTATSSYITSVSSPLSVTSGNLTIDLSAYLTSATAASTYQTQAGMSSYLTTSTAASTYLTQSNAASTYQTISGMSSYLTTSAAASTYAPIATPSFTGLATFDNPGNFAITVPNGASDYTSISAGIYSLVLSGTETIRISGAGIKYPDGVTQSVAYPGSSGFLLKADNLSGLASTSTARSNLGLGTLATVNDAPSDGSQYARKDGAWAIVSSPTQYITSVSSPLSVTSQNLSVDLSAYLTTATAASTYQTISGMSSYLTTSSAASTYQTIAGMSSYLTTASAASTYAPLASPALTGNPTAPTPATADNDTSIATTAFVKAQGYLTSAPVTSVAGKTGAVTLVVGDVSGAAPLASPTFTGTVTIPAGASISGYATTASLSSYAPLASPALTGTPTAPTAAVDTNTTQVATTAYVVGQGYLKSATASSTYAPLASPALTGTPTAPTATAGTSTTQIATTAFVTTADNLKANLASPAFTGTPTAPTATAGTNTTQIATTAFVTAAIPTNNVKAWVNFNGTGTVAIRASMNVSSITDNGVGDYTINFTTAISDANYSVVSSGYGRAGFSTGLHCAVAGWGSAPTTKTTSAARIAVAYYDANLYDHNDVSVAILR